jgi:hypothetical protein
MEFGEIYNLIGSNIIHCLDGKWKEAKLFIEAYPDYVKFTGEYLDQANQNKKMKIRNFNLDEVENAVWELLKITTKNENNRWNKAIFRVWPDNNFDMDFIWDQELDDEIKKN